MRPSNYDGRPRHGISPQFVQIWVRTERLFRMRDPQPLQSWDVYAGGTTSTRLPAHSALQARITRKEYHPASWMDVLRPDFALTPLCRYPPFPSGFGSGRRLMLRTWRSSK